MISLSQSKVKTFLRCPKKYEFRYVQNLVPKEKPLPMERGLWIHECLEAFYKGRNWKRTALLRLKLNFRSLFDEEREALGDLPSEVERIVESYTRYWDDTEWEILAVEKEFAVKLKSGLTLKGKIDLVIRDALGVWVVEHKSNKRLPTEGPRIPDPQTTIYNYALRSMGLEGMGTIHNHIRTTPPKTPYVLKTGGLSKARGIDTDYYTYRQALKREGLDLKDYRDILLKLKRDDRFFRRFRIPWKKTAVKSMMADYKTVAWMIDNTKQFPRHISQMCVRDCFYFQLCMVELHGGNASALKRQKYSVTEAMYA